MKQTGLFDDEARANEAEREAAMPLAARLRPRTLDEYVGQQHLVGPGRILRRMIETDRVSSIVLWGPPGTGKTTLAQIIANATRSQFVGLSAVSAGVADLRRVIDEAGRRQREHKQRTILLIDEIHRFNKGQQDSVLHAVEQGVVTLIGATTENPSFEVNPALLSRCRVFTLKSLSEAEITTLIDRALSDRERGLGNLQVDLIDEAKRALVSLADGDARTALNVLELAATSVEPDAAGQRTVLLGTVEDAMQQRALRYDQAGEQHFDVVSALIKSLRGSDPDAALYWLARMLEAGEDPMFIVRRLVVLAAEDVGLADPQALVIAVAAQQAVHFVGMPEGYLPLAEAVIYLATAPKSNSTIASYGRAREVVEARGNLPVPLHLRNAPTGLMKSLGYGRNYEYSHDFAADDPRRYRQRYLPPEVTTQLYEPGNSGYEVRIRERLEKIAALRRGGPPDSGPQNPDVKPQR